MTRRSLEDWATGNSALHRLDPRAKLIATFATLLVILSEPRDELWAWPPFFALITSAWLISGVPARVAGKRCLRAAPFLIVPALLLPLSAALTGGDAVGLVAGLSLALRACAAFVLVTLLIATTRMSSLLHGLHQLGLPRPLATLANLSYRYLFVLTEEVQRLSRALASRSAGRQPRLLARPRLWGKLIAVLFLRGWERAHQVHNAMVARGFEGQFPGPAPHALAASDLLGPIVFVLLVALVRVFL